MSRFVLATLFALPAASACDNYIKVVENVCAEACLGSTVGICPVSIVVDKGGLSKGSCSDSGYTQANGTTSQKAGPCGTLKFNDYVKPSLASGDPDICSASDTGLTGAQQAVTCYVGNFMTKMLGELDGGNKKTAEHVRVHLLPYLGGAATLSALGSDQPGNPNCTVCYTDADTGTGLTQLRDSLTAAQKSTYDAIKVCYARLTEDIMYMLPKSPCGVWLQPESGVSPFDQTLGMMKTLFAKVSSSNFCGSK